jgi:hypothetical protein
MRYYTAMPKFNRRERKAGLDKEMQNRLTALDMAILKKADKLRGEDIMGLITACKPYKNKWGGNQFATSAQVRGAIIKLEKLGVLQER